MIDVGTFVRVRCLTRIASVSLIALLTLGTGIGQCRAWALKKELQDQRLLQESLTAKVLKNRRIKYCVILEKPHAALPRNTVKLELLQALSLWTREIGPCSTQEVPADQDWDLKVLVGPAPKGDTSHGASCEARPEGVVIRINTDRVDPMNADKHYRWQTFTSLVAKGGDKLEPAAREANAQRLTVHDLSERYSVPYYEFYWTPYRVFIHELGHGFGLADTNDEQLNRQNDGRWRSSGHQPDSVMNTSAHFYLTTDDLQGLRAAIDLVKSQAGAKSK